MCTLSASFMAIAFVCDVIVWYYVKDVSMYDDDPELGQESVMKSERKDESLWIKLDTNKKCYTNEIS